MVCDACLPCKRPLLGFALTSVNTAATPEEKFSLALRVSFSASILCTCKISQAKEVSIYFSLQSV
jgi:hypothetical protein